MSDTIYTAIYKGSFIIAQLMRDRLEANGIVPIIKDESESGRLAGFGSTGDYIELHVHQDELERSKEIINTVLDEMEDNQQLN